MGETSCALVLMHGLYEGESLPSQFLMEIMGIGFGIRCQKVDDHGVDLYTNPSLL